MDREFHNEKAQLPDGAKCTRTVKVAASLAAQRGSEGRTKMKSLRRLLAGGTLALALVLPSLAHAEDDVRLRLNWMYYGSHAGFAYGKDKGMYKDVGIDLDIRSGNGSGSAHRLVANGDSTFSYGSCGSGEGVAAGQVDDLGRMGLARVDVVGDIAVAPFARNTHG
ncbi:ABC transporter substrate-binding protein [Leptolyngbya sp. 15MV]|nr:ABC transporter substrate-binding protein [Leptolyngbya sp. 15MV]